MDEQHPVPSLLKTAYPSYWEQLVFIAQSTSPNCVDFIEYFFATTEKAIQNGFEGFDLAKYFRYKKIQCPGNLCGKILERGVFAFKCLECMNEDNSIICIECFNKSNHTGHRFEKISVFGGCCDCGDDEKWKQEGSCVDHQNKNEEVVVDEGETANFIKEMKFLHYILLKGYCQFQEKSIQLAANLRKVCVTQFSIALIKFLKQFNENSVVSNEMTFRLLVEDYEHWYSDLFSADMTPIKIKGQRLLDLIFYLKGLTTYELTIVELYTCMFTRFEFKVQLTIAYANAMIEDPSLLRTDFSHISCQIFTSHRIIQQLIQQERLPLMNINNIPQQEIFDTVANYYVRFYIDIEYLSSLYSNTGVAYLKYQFGKGSILSMANYSLRAAHPLQKQTSINYYGIEEIYLVRLFSILKRLRNEKQLLIKMMADCTNAINSETKPNPTVYITYIRTFIMCLFQYCDGDLTRALQPHFLQRIGILNSDNTLRMEETSVYGLTTRSLIAHMLSSTLYLFRRYSILLASREQVQKYYTFYSFTFNKHFKIISADSVLIKFCLLVIKKYDSLNYSSLFMAHFSPMQDMLRNEQFEDNYETNYLRKVRLGMFAEYIRLLVEITYLDYAEICLLSQLGQVSSEQMMGYYCGLLASFGPIKVEDFKKLCIDLLGEEIMHFQEFVIKFGRLQDKKIQLKQEYTKQYRPYDFRYLASKAKSPKFSNRLFINERVCATQPKGSILTPYPCASYEIDLRRAIFSETLVAGVLHIAKKYSQIMMGSDPKVCQIDMPHFVLFLQVLLNINNIIKSERISVYFQNLSQDQRLFSHFPADFKANLFLALHIDRKEDIAQQQNEEQKELRKKQLMEKKRQKMEKFKKKKQINTAKFQMDEPMSENKDTSNQEESGEKKTMKEGEEDDELLCMVCKNESEDKPLGLMSFIQNSSVVARKYLFTERPVIFISSCNHAIHEECYNRMYGNRDYNFCNLCKNSCNILLTLPLKKQEQGQRSPDTLARVEISMAILDSAKNEAEDLEDKTHDLKDEKEEQVCLTIGQRIIESIAASIFYRVFADAETFTRSQRNTNCFLLLNLMSQADPIQIKSLMQTLNKQFTNKETQQVELFRTCYKFIILEILKLIHYKQTVLEESWNIDPKQIPHVIIHNIKETLAAIKHQKVQPIKAYHPLKLIELPEKLSDLCIRVGVCPNCKRTTNQISLCMLCDDFQSCVGCQVLNLTKHAIEHHGGASIFIRVDSGLAIYIGNKKSWVYPSIYINFLEEPYETGSKEDKSKYRLGEREVQGISTTIRRHRIEQEVRYREVTKNRPKYGLNSVISFVY